MEDFVKVENHQDLVRDTYSGAVINTNRTEYDNYMDNYHRLKREKIELEQLKTQVSSLTSDMGEIKNLLKLLVQEKNNGN
jgi:hypothetical protein